MLSDDELTVEQAAAMLGTSPDEVERLIKRSLLSSRLHIAPDGSRHRLISRSACRNLMDSGFTPTSDREVAVPVEKETIPPTDLTTKSWSSATHVIADASAQPQQAIPAVEPVAPAESGMEPQLLSLIREVSALDARLQKVEEQFEVTRQIEKDVATLTERLRSLGERLDTAQGDLGGGVAQLQKQIVEIEEAIESLHTQATRLGESTKSQQDQLRQHEDMLLECAEHIENLKHWTEDVETRKPLAQVKKFLVERKPRTEDS